MCAQIFPKSHERKSADDAAFVEWFAKVSNPSSNLSGFPSSMAVKNLCAHEAVSDNVV